MKLSTYVGYVDGLYLTLVIINNMLKTNSMILDFVFNNIELYVNMFGNCRCLTTDSLPRGYPGQLFGLQRMLELDGECRDSRFILV
jgi:hypothetical protein